MAKGIYNLMIKPKIMKSIKIIIISLGMISFLACSSEDDIEKNNSCY